MLLEVPASAVRQEREIKGMYIGKEEIKLFTDNIIVYVETPKDSTTTKS